MPNRLTIATRHSNHDVVKLTTPVFGMASMYRMCAYASDIWQTIRPLLLANTMCKWAIVDDCSPAHIPGRHGSGVRIGAVH